MKRIELIGIAILVVLCLGFVALSVRLNQPVAPADSGIGVESLKSSEILIETLVITAAGATGECHGYVTTTNTLIGELVAVYVDWSATAQVSTTTDITLSFVSPWAGNIMVKTDSTTDAFFFPQAGAITGAGVAVTDSYVPFQLMGKLQLNTGQSVSSDALGTMYIWYRRP